METEFLEEIGLTKNEIIIYLSLIKNGKISAGSISEKTSLHRGYVYDTLNRLSNKGIVSVIKRSGTNYYEGVHPRKLNQIMDEKRKKIKDIVPSLIEIYKKDKSNCDIDFFEGKEGIKTVHLKLYNVFLQNKKRELVQLGLEKSIDEHPLKYFLYSIKNQAKKDGIIRDIKSGKLKYRVLLVQKLDGKKRDIKKWANYKHLPSKFKTNNVNFIVVDHYIMLESTENEPFAILIQNKQLALFYKNLFNTLWSISHK
jgi:sugar-specific transcriptional regulator TrmB